MSKIKGVSFDQYQRYWNAASIIRLFRTFQPLKILEVGANSHKNLSIFLPDEKILFLDKTIPDNADPDFVAGDATQLQFLNNDFDFVIALDVYEHIAEDQRRSFLSEAMRVASRGVLISAPFNFEKVVSAEIEMNDCWKHLTGDDHFWLKEHIDNGLPSLENTIDILREFSPFIGVFSHGNLELWQSLLKVVFCHDVVAGVEESAALIYEAYNELLCSKDFDENGYRNFIVVFKSENDYLRFNEYLSSCCVANVDPALLQLMATASNLLIETAHRYSLSRQSCIELSKKLNVISDEEANLIERLGVAHTAISEVNSRLEQEQLKNASMRSELDESRLENIQAKDQLEQFQEEILVLSKRSEKTIFFWSEFFSNKDGLVVRSFDQFQKWSALCVARAMRLVLPNMSPGLPLSSMLKKAFEFIKHNGFKAFIKKSYKKITHPVSAIPIAHECSDLDIRGYDEWYERFVQLDELKARMLAEQLEYKHKPHFIVIVRPSTIDGLVRYFDESLLSVRKQKYREFTVWIFCESSADYSAWSSVASSKGDGLNYCLGDKTSLLELIGGMCYQGVDVLCHDLRVGEYLNEDALLYLAIEAVNNHDADSIYSDFEVVSSLDGKREPFFLPDWNEEFFISYGHAIPSFFTRIRSLAEVQFVLTGSSYPGLLCMQIMLQSMRGLHIDVKHCSLPLVGLNTSDSVSNPEELLQQFFSASSTPVALRYSKISSVHVRYLSYCAEPLVSVIIPTKDKIEYLHACISGLLRKTAYKNIEIVIVDNASSRTRTLEYLNELSACGVAKILPYSGVFNYSAINNYAVTQCKGDILCFLNNDIEIIKSDWLGEMVSLAVLDDVGAVGAMLLYEDQTIQHAGVFSGLMGGAAHFLRKKQNQFWRANIRQEVSAVTGACLVMRRSIFDSVGGFNSENLPINFNDIDLCFKIRKKGKKIIYTPWAKLFHLESKSRGDTPPSGKEVNYLTTQWRETLHCDPFYSPNLSLNSCDYQLAWPPRTKNYFDFKISVSQRISDLDFYLDHDNFSRAKNVARATSREYGSDYGKVDGLSIVILNLNKPELIVPLVSRLKEIKAQYEAYVPGSLLQILIGDTGSSHPKVLKLYADEGIEVIKGLKYHFSKNNNDVAFGFAKCSKILFLNNDVIFADGFDLIARMMRALDGTNIGLVGALLYFEDKTIQHAGVDFFRDVHIRGLCYHPAARSALTPDAYPSEFEMPAVTGACLMISADDFLRVNGFCQEYEAECQDVDLCLMLKRLGKTSLVVNGGYSLHLENATRPKGEENWSDRRLFLRRWSSFIDAKILDYR